MGLSRTVSDKRWFHSKIAKFSHHCVFCVPIDGVPPFKHTQWSHLAVLSRHKEYTVFHTMSFPHFPVPHFPVSHFQRPPPRQPATFPRSTAANIMFCPCTFQKPILILKWKCNNLDCLLGLYWTGLSLLNGFLFLVFFIVFFSILGRAVD